MAEPSKKEFRYLPNEYSANGFLFKQFKKGKLGAIYVADDESGKVYEIFCIRIAKATTLKMGGKIMEIPEREKIPSNESFGSTSWAIYNDEKKALKIFEEIENKTRPSKQDNE